MPTDDPILDWPIINLSDADPVFFKDLAEGTKIIGASGCGKTTTSGMKLACALLRMPRSGALILTAKREETHNWIKYAEACGRRKDLIIFNAESGDCFDPLHYEFTRPGRGAGDMESIIDLFSTLVSIGKKEVGHGHDPFWERGCEQLMRNCIKLLDLAGERISIASIDRVVKSLPTRPEEHQEPEWQGRSYCAQLVNAVEARQETLTEEQWSDLVVATQYIFSKWPAFDERPRSSLEMTWSGMAERNSCSIPLTAFFCGGSLLILARRHHASGKNHHLRFSDARIRP